MPSSCREQKNERGFTLIELMLYFTIVGVLLFAITSTTMLFFESRTKAKVIADVEQQGAQVMATILQTIRNADSITSPGIGTSASSLTLVVPVGANSPTVIDLNAGALRIQEGVASPVTLTSSRLTASSLTFQNLSRASTNGTIRVQFTLTSVNNNGRSESTYTKTFTSSATIKQ